MRKAPCTERAAVSSIMAVGNHDDKKITHVGGWPRVNIGGLNPDPRALRVREIRSNTETRDGESAGRRISTNTP